MSDVSNLMKRCQRGVGGRNALDEAHGIMAECYGTLGLLQAEVERLRNVIKILERDIATALAEELRRLCAERDQYRMRLRNLLAHGSNIHALPFADKILGKLRRFNEQVGDPDSGGSDIGRHWLDMLTQLGLLNRVQRSPAMWEITAQGEDALCAYGSPAFY